MLNRFYITIALWFLSICALGLLATSIAQVIVGVMPLGLMLIVLLLYYVPESTETTASQGLNVDSRQLGSQQDSLLDWPAQAAANADAWRRLQ